MSTARRLHHSYEDYLRALAMGDLRLEFLAGEIFAMAGGSPLHGMIAARIIQALGRRLPSSCAVLTSDVKIRIAATGLTTFPDVSVVCGEIAVADDDRHAITNPTLLFEVSSPSTRDYDAGEKLRHYQAIPSLEAVVLVAQDERHVTVVRRAAAGWSRTEHTAAFSLDHAGELEVGDLYP